MTTNDKKPAIRFNGFEEEWEEKKLGEMCEITTGKLDANAMVEDGIYDFYTSGIKKYRINSAAFEGPAITIAGNGATVGYMHLADGLFNAYQRTYVLSVFKANRQYLYSEIANKLPRKIQEEARASNIPYIVINMLTDLHISLPDKAEQTQIGTYFRNLDSLITLQQKKCEQLANVKKSMLQKMFPQNGSTVPELRFAGFTGDWEQRKFGEDIISIQTGTNLLGSIENDGMPLLKMGNIQRGFFDINKIEFLSASTTVECENIVYYGDFFFNTRNTLELVGKGATWTGENGKYAFNSNIARVKLRNADTVFFNYLYNSEDMLHQVHARAMGTTSVAAIYPRALDSIEYKLPTLEEQIRIGTFLLNLDNLISLQRRKLDKLNNIKKSMLQKMFV